MGEAKKVSWRDLIKVHPAAEMFPEMGGDEFKSLVEDIRQQGLRTAISTWFDKNEQEWLLDGRNRLNALEELGYRFKIVYTGGYGSDRPHLKITKPDSKKTMFVVQRSHQDIDPYSYVTSLNIERRHLTAAQRKEIAETLLKANPARSDRSIAKETGVHHETVATVRKDGEASGEIRHIPPTERVDAGGRKRARKTASKVKTAEAQPEQPAAEDQPRVVDDAPASEAELSVPRHPTEGQVSTALHLLSHGLDHDDRWPQIIEWCRFEVFPLLPFDAALIAVKAWFAALPISQQSQVLEELESANDTVDVGAMMGDVEAAAHHAEKAAA
jgi:hypothetical protein